jgi:hypothetical protein
MQHYNIPARVQRESECGLCWEERITNGTGSLEVDKYAPVRVRATGATTVTLDGVLGATMSAGEILIFNTGIGDPTDQKRTVTVVVAGAAAFVQVARMLERKPREDIIA